MTAFNKTPRSLLLSCLTAMALAAPTWPAWGHGDEDHSHDEPSPAAQAAPQSGPRASAQTESFEIVAALDKPTLTIYLDDFNTNTPIADAKVEVQSGAFQATATMQSPGVYTLAAAALAQPAQHPLTISVETADTADLLSLTLDTREAHANDGNAPDDHAGSRWPASWLWGLGVAVALLAAGLIAASARKRRSKGTTAETDTRP